MPRGPSLLTAEHVDPIEGRWTLGAVDGGSALVLDGSGLSVGAMRVSGLAWRSHALANERPAGLEVRMLDDALARELAGPLAGLPPPTRPEELLERWRGLREWDAAMALAADLGEGDVLALDGALAQPVWPGALLARLADACRDRGVLLVGVCKSASVHVRGVPGLLAAARAGRGLAEPWLVELPPSAPGTRAAAARFVRGGKVFKLELGAREDPMEAVGKLAPWTRDAGCPGYPYPLALAHLRCALDEALVEDIRHRLREAAAAEGVDAAAWEEVFGDFHEVLDRAV
jgi:NurA domain-containing protein